MLSAAAVVIVINAATKFLRTFIFPRFGKTGVQAIVFICALIGTAYFNYGSQFPSVQIYLIQAIAFFSSAITLYEVLFSKLDLGWLFGSSEGSKLREV